MTDINNIQQANIFGWEQDKTPVNNLNYKKRFNIFLGKGTTTNSYQLGAFRFNRYIVDINKIPNIDLNKRYEVTYKIKSAELNSPSYYNKGNSYMYLLFNGNKRVTHIDYLINVGFIENQQQSLAGFTNAVPNVGNRTTSGATTTCLDNMNAKPLDNTPFIIENLSQVSEIVFTNASTTGRVGAGFCQALVQSNNGLGILITFQEL